MGNDFAFAQHRKLIDQLRSLEQEGRNVAGYAEYLEKMTLLDAQMKALSQRDRWGVTKPLDAQTLAQLQSAIQETATAGEAYLKNVREAIKGGKKLSLKQGVPGLVNTLQGLLASDAQTLGRYDPSMKLSLPELLESSRTKTLVLNSEEMDTVGGNQNSRIPLSIRNADGKEYRGVFTKATYSRVGSLISEALAETENEIKTDEGKQEFRKLMEKMRSFSDAHYPNLKGIDDTRLFLYMIELHTATGAGRGGYGGRKMFKWNEFCENLGLNAELIGEDAIRSFGSRALRIRYKMTNEMINALDLGVRDGARIDSRNSAMSAVADLLGVPKLLARSTNMRFTDGEGRTQEGTMMDYGKGLDLNDDLALFTHVNDAPFSGADSHKALRQLADLQALDYVCGNVDRHAGNLFYQTNEAGDIIGVQGIDNDSSFGSFARGGENYNRLPGTDNMNCISKSMSDRILKLDPTQLRFMLRGRGLSEREMDFAVNRMNDLKAAILKGREHYKDHPPISADTERPFDAGYLRTVSDEEFKCLSLEKMVVDEYQSNLFDEVREFMDSRLKHARQDDYAFDPKAASNAEEKKLPERMTQGQLYTGQGLLHSIRGADKLVRDGEFKIDDLTNKYHGSSPQFDNMVQALKKLADLEKKLDAELKRRQEQGHVHFSAAEYERLRRPITEARAELDETADLYLNKKMRERHANSPEQLRGKNPYEQARIDHAKKILEYTRTHEIPQPIPEKVLTAREGEGLEIKLGNELSAEEEAKIALRMLREIHEKHGLEAPEAYVGMEGETFNRTVEQAAQEEGPVIGPEQGLNA